MAIHSLWDKLPNEIHGKVYEFDNTYHQRMKRSVIPYLRIVWIAWDQTGKRICSDNMPKRCNITIYHLLQRTEITVNYGSSPISLFIKRLNPSIYLAMRRHWYGLLDWR